MKLYQTRGIVFRTLKYSESSIIADIYTLGKGLKSYIVSGVRPGKTGGKATLLRPLNILTIVAYETDGDKLSRLKEMSLEKHYQKIHLDIITSSMAIFMLEVCRNALTEREAHESLYNFIEDWLHFLDTTDNYSPGYHLLFMTELSHHLGFGPMSNYSSESPLFDLLEGSFCDVAADHRYFIEADRAKLFYELCQYNRNSIYSWQPPKGQRNLLAEDLILYFRLHIPGFKDLKSFHVLKQVL
jgi:DNA repair protein RecO (recombination protein O)